MQYCQLVTQIDMVFLPERRTYRRHVLARRCEDKKYKERS